LYICAVIVYVMRKFLSLFILLFVSFELHAGGLSKSEYWLERHTQYALNKGDYPLAAKYGLMLKNIGEYKHNDESRLYSYMYLGQALMMCGYQSAAKYYMQKSLSLAEKLSNYSALCSVYNGLGLYSSMVDRNYYRSLAYYFEGLNVAKKSQNLHLEAILLANICDVYYWEKDPTGLKYALECYNIGHNRHDPYAIFVGANSTAYMYYLKKDYKQALRYIKESEFVMHQNGYYEQAVVYNLYGEILFALGRDSQAIEYYKKSISYSKTVSATRLSDTYWGYALVDIKLKKYDEAIALLNNGIKTLNRKNFSVRRYDLLAALSKCYELKSQYAISLRYYKVSQTEKDSTFNVEKEAAINEIQTRYDTEHQNRLMKQTRLMVIEKEKKLEVTFLMLALVLVVLGGVVYMYRRTHNLYRKIVRQFRDSVTRENNLKDEISQLQTDRLNDVKYVKSSLTDQKSSELFRNLDRLMMEKRLYTDNLLTKEKVADYLNTNRTYLSRVINEKTGQTFTKYVNQYRIKEAIKMLSDPYNDTPLKAICYDLGFNSMSTFYSLFSSVTGMTPSQFRQHAK